MLRISLFALPLCWEISIVNKNYVKWDIVNKNFDTSELESYRRLMKKLMQEVISFSKTAGIMPTTVLQRSAGLGGHVWKNWKSGSSCTMATAEKIRAYMEKHKIEEP